MAFELEPRNRGSGRPRPKFSVPSRHRSCAARDGRTRNRNQGILVGIDVAGTVAGTCEWGVTDGTGGDSRVSPSPVGTLLRHPEGEKPLEGVLSGAHF